MKKILALLAATLLFVSCAEEIFPDTDTYRVKYTFDASMIVDDITLDIDYVFRFTDEYMQEANMSYHESGTHEITVGPFHYNDIVRAKIVYDDIMYTDVVSHITMSISKNGGPYILCETSDNGEIRYQIK